MKRNCILFCLLGSLFSLICCSVKKMPEGDLLSVEFARSGMRAGNEYEGRVEKDSSGVITLTAMKDPYGPLFEKRLSANDLQKFRQIIETNKMYKYKDSYRPMVRVLDGWSWTFTAVFSDGTSISSHGSNAGPSDDGLQEIRELMQELIKDGVKIDTEDEEEKDDD